MHVNYTIRPTNLRPVVVRGKHGDLIGYYHPPAVDVVTIGDVLVVPAFAEEMNRCRSMVTMQAHALAAIGMGTLVLDLSGTGDSAGEFAQADWDGWCDDMRLGLAWLRQHGNGCRTLWGVRLGALLAAQLAAQDEQIDHLLMWMPVVAGKPYWTQFLRMRIASEMGLPNGVKSTDSLRRQSAAGQVVEASGYEVGPALAQQLDQLDMPTAAALAGKTIAVFDVAASEGIPTPRATAKLVDDWRANGLSATLQRVEGSQFWQVHEREEAPRLIDASIATVSAWPGMAPGQRKTHEAAALAAQTLAAAHEYPVTFPCAGAELSGVVHRGDEGAQLGMVIVVAGGPQFRVGAHRQFVSLARLVAAKGYPVLRFDLRGMGDSSGEHLGYLDSESDIRAAIDQLMHLHPSMQEVALFGECNSASGILFYASGDTRVRRIALVNPWVRTPGVQAEAILKHYYLDRLRSREFWRSVWSGKFKFRASAASFIQVVTKFLQGRKASRAAAVDIGQGNFDHLPLPSRTAEGLRRFRGAVLLLMSGNDLIAREFDEVTRTSKAWQGLLSDKRILRTEIAGADHTFSKPAAKAQAQQTILDWLSSQAPATTR